MKIHETIKKQLIDAMRSKDEIKLNTLRSLIAMFSNELISKKSSDEFLDDDNSLNLIRRNVKQHKDSIEQFLKGGRNDLVSKEKAELDILEAYLPKSMSLDEISKFINEKISSSGEIDKSKAGQFMGMIMKELKGKADGADVKKVIDELLNK